MPLKNANVGKHCCKCRKRKAQDGLRNEKEGGTEACTHPPLDSAGKGHRKAQVRAGRREAGWGQQGRQWQEARGDACNSTKQAQTSRLGGALRGNFQAVPCSLLP